jgi:hypothetical protein
MTPAGIGRNRGPAGNGRNRGPAGGDGMAPRRPAPPA